MSPQQAVDSWTDRDERGPSEANFVDPFLVHPV